MQFLPVPVQFFLSSMALVSILSGCGGHSKGGSSTTSSVSIVSQAAGENKSINTVDPNATLTQVLTGPASVPGASVMIAPGTLSISADIILEKSADLSSTNAVSELGLGETLSIETAGSGLIIRPSEDVDLSQPLQIVLPVPAGTGLTAAEIDSQRLAVVYKYFDATMKQLTLGMKIIDGVDVTLGVDAAARRILTMKGYFGSYWVVVLNRAVTVADVPAEKVSAEPILNADRVVVMQTSGIVAETTISTQQEAASTLVQALLSKVILYNSSTSPYKIQLASNGTMQISDVSQSTAGQWLFADGTLTITYESPLVIEGTDNDAAGQEIPVKFTTYGLSIKAGTASGFLNVAELMKETYTNAPTAEPKLYASDAFEFKIIPYSSFTALAAKEGETYALPMGSNTAGIFRLDAASQVTDLGMNRTGFTWTQGSEGLTIKDSDGNTFTYKAIASTDLAQITLAETVQGSAVSVMSGLGALIKSSLGTYNVSNISQWAGDYDSNVFSNYFLRFETNRLASLLDRSTLVSAKDFLWSVDGVLIGRNYGDNATGDLINSLSDMLACDAQTKDCYVYNTRRYQVLELDATLQKFLVFRTIEWDGTIHDGMLDIMTKRLGQ